MALLFYAKSISLRLIFTYYMYYTPPSPTFQLVYRYLACHIINMQRNCRKNSCTSGSAPPTNPATNPQIALHDRSMVARSTDACANDRSIDRQITQHDRSIAQIRRWRTTHTSMIMSQMFVNMSYKLLRGISPNLQVWCSLTQ